MNDAQRGRVFDAMMHGIDPKKFPMIAQMASEDLNSLEPIIDQIVEEEIKSRGKNERRS